MSQGSASNGGVNPIAFIVGVFLLLGFINWSAHRDDPDKQPTEPVPTVVEPQESKPPAA